MAEKVMIIPRAEGDLEKRRRLYKKHARLPSKSARARNVPESSASTPAIEAAVDLYLRATPAYERGHHRPLDRPQDNDMGIWLSTSIRSPGMKFGDVGGCCM